MAFAPDSSGIRTLASANDPREKTPTNKSPRLKRWFPGLAIGGQHAVMLAVGAAAGRQLRFGVPRECDWRDQQEREYAKQQDGCDALCRPNVPQPKLGFPSSTCYGSLSVRVQPSVTSSQASARVDSRSSKGRAWRMSRSWILEAASG